MNRCYIILLTVFLTLVNLETLIATDCSQVSDGCNGPSFFEPFTPACNRHDACYKCGVKFGQTKSQCDQSFQRNVFSTCSSMSFFKKVSCYNSAVIYYNAARIGGSGYQEEELPECTSDVQTCL